MSEWAEGLALLMIIIGFAVWALAHELFSATAFEHALEYQGVAE